jgi:hypothetical protein
MFFLQHLDSYWDHATLFPAQVWVGDTWEFHLNILLCIIYVRVCVCVCVCISFWLISLYLWLVLVFLFSKVYYGFTPLRHHTSQHVGVGSPWLLKITFLDTYIVGHTHKTMLQYMAYLEGNMAMNATFLQSMGLLWLKKIFKYFV